MMNPRPDEFTGDEELELVVGEVGVRAHCARAEQEREEQLVLLEQRSAHHLPGRIYTEFLTIHVPYTGRAEQNRNVGY